MDEQETGTCSVCGKHAAPVVRTYYRYDIDCDCCNKKHFHIVWHHPHCNPKPPPGIKIFLEIQPVNYSPPKETFKSGS